MGSASKINKAALIVSPIEGIKLFTHPRNSDLRGYFQRISDYSEIQPYCSAQFIQSSISFNAKKGTIRGLHFQAAPSKEWKYITCLQGALFDCLVDVREKSSTYGNYLEFELTENNGLSILIPPGVAHGFQTLVDNTLINYQMTDSYNQSLARTLSWDDKSINIKWPLEVSEISKSDLGGAPWPVVY